MGWADNYIKKLQAGETIKFRPRGNSMVGRIDSGQLVTVCPAIEVEIKKRDVVLCKVSGKQFLHLVNAIDEEGNYQIANNRGHVNGWTKNVYGVVIAIED